MSSALVAAAAMLGSAIFHSFMSLLTKRAGDKLTFRAVSMLVSVALFTPVLLLSPFPGWEVWRFLLIGALLVWIYNLLMIATFERGDMNLVYPVMRGGAPALAAVGAYIFLGETLSTVSILGLAIASGALLAFAWPERGGAPKAAALGFAVAAAAMTASYSVNDAAGVRASGNAIIYAAWFFVLCAALLSATALVRRRRAILPLARQELGPATLSAFMGVGTYTLALFAYSIAPVAPMAALRETSVVFGALLVALVLKEPFGLRRLVMAVLLGGGLALLQVG